MAKKILKTLGLIVLVLAILLIGGYSYISSGHFIQAQVLPRIGDALGTEVVAEDASFSALSQLELKNLRVGSEADPLMKAGTIRVQYRALSLLSRKIEINEILLDGVMVAVTPEKLAALKKAPPPEKQQQEKPETKEKKSEKPSAPIELLIENVKVKNFAFSYVDAGVSEVQIPELNLELPRLAGGSDFHLTLDTQAKVVTGSDMDAELRSITLDLQGALGLDLLPTSLNLDVNLGGIAGTAGPVALDGRRIQLVAELAGDAQHYDLKRLGLVEYNGEAKDAELGLTGTFGLDPQSAALDLSANIPAGSLLDLVGAMAGGLDFGKTAINYKGHVELASSQLSSSGDLSVKDLTVAVPASKIAAMRPLQISAGHTVAFDLDQRILTLSRLDGAVEDQGRKVVDLELKKTMTLDLQNPGGDAATQLAVRVDRLDLTMLNALLAGQPDLRIVSGEVNRAVNLDIQQGGRQVVLDVGGGGVDHLVIQQGDRRIGPLRINHEARLELADLKNLTIDRFHVELVPLDLGTSPAASLDLAGQMALGPIPKGMLTATLSGRGDRLLAVAKPFMSNMNLTIGQPQIEGRLAIDLSQGPDNANADFALTVKGIEAKSPGLNRTVALDIDTKLQGGLADGKRIHIAPSYTQFNGLGKERLVDISLSETDLSLADMENHPERVQLPVDYAINDLDLARLLPFVPMEAGVRRMAGTVNLNGKVLLTGPAQSIHLESEAKLEGIDFALNDGTALASPISPSLDLKLVYAVGGIAQLDRLGFVLRRTGGQEPMLDLDASARFDTSMNPKVKNTVAVTTHGPIRLDALEALLIQPEKTEPVQQPQAPPVETGEPATPAPPPDLWIEASVAMEQATYHQMEISNLTVNATYRNGQLDLTKAYAGINDGTLNASGTCDLTDPAKPGYDLAITGSQLPFAPMISSFVPHAPFALSGGLKAADIRLKGDGFDLPSMQKNLTANVDVQLDQLVVEQLEGTLGRLTETLLLGIFNMDMQDMVFADGGLKLAIDSKHYGDNNIHLEQLLMRSPVFMLDGKGTVQFGGKWEPDIEIKTGFSDGKTASLNHQGFAIASESDPSGYHAGPVIPLKGDLTNLRNQASIVTAVLVSAGKISAEDAMKADLANGLLGVLSGEGGGLGGLLGGGKDGEKADVGETVGNILQGVLGGQQSKNDKKDKKKKSDPAETIGNVLNGLFGN